jgi:hypothetical protein|tara:strand:- start:228 stop:407 length:180 start_codon:yes stop_codon:yes gene_type:complete
MTELNEMHFETIDSNKDKMYQRKKLEYLEDRITTLEKALGKIHQILGRYQMKEGDNNAK